VRARGRHAGRRCGQPARAARWRADGGRRRVRCGVGQGIPVPGDGPGVANEAKAGCSRRETRWAMGGREMGETVGRERKMGRGGSGRAAENRLGGTARL
jgi:hypothetical protein